MTFATEPEFVFPGGVVSTENTVILRGFGIERLTLFDENIIKI